MATKFWKGCAFASVAYILGYLALLNFALSWLYAIEAVMFAWITFAAYRVCGLTMRNAYRPDAADWDREDFRFWLGEVLSSVVLAAFFLITPVRVG